MYDVIVLGGGIAGLHTAYRLHQERPQLKLLVLEKNDYFGGRIYTVEEKGLCFEAGAGRYNDTHVLFQRLLRSLGLSSKSKAIPSDLHFVPSGKYPARYFNQDPFDTMNPVLTEAKRTPRDVLRKQTFIQFARSVLSQEDSRFLEDAFGYHEQLMEMNAFDALKLFDKGMHTKHSFFVLDGGMSQVIDAMVSRLGKDVCKKNQEVVHIAYDSTAQQFQLQVKGTTTPLVCKQCVAALPRPALEAIPFFRGLKNDLQSIGLKTLCRIYAQFDKDNVWFKHIPKSTTNNALRYVIPIDRNKGLIMISYTDGKFARYWKTKYEKTMIKRLQENIQKTFDFTIADPIYTRKCYWTLGTAYWKPRVKSHEVARRMLQPMDCPLYVCGENYSTNQGWMEGALETSVQVVAKVLTA